MRLFVAIALPAGARDEVEAAVAWLRPAWPQLRWTGQDDWHVTLAFLGEVGPGIPPGLDARLERAAHRHPALQLSVAGAGAFPGPGRARVLWAGIHLGQVAEAGRVGRASPDRAGRADLPGKADKGGGRTALAALAASVAAGARRAGAPPPAEGRRYHPHLTLARCREPADICTLVGGLADFAGSSWLATDIHLIRSRLAGQPRYEAIGSWPLRPLAGEPSVPDGREADGREADGREG